MWRSALAIIAPQEVREVTSQGSHLSGFQPWSYPKTAGWFFWWKIPSINGWWLGVPPILGKFQMGLSNRESDTGTQYTWPFFVKDDEIHYETYIHQDLQIIQIDTNPHHGSFEASKFWGNWKMPLIRGTVGVRHLCTHSPVSTRWMRT